MIRLEDDKSYQRLLLMGSQHIEKQAKQELDNSGREQHVLKDRVIGQKFNEQLDVVVLVEHLAIVQEKRLLDQHDHQ